jgi:hypothetical protein
MNVGDIVKVRRGHIGVIGLGIVLAILRKNKVKVLTDTGAASWEYRWNLEVINECR